MNCASLFWQACALAPPDRVAIATATRSRTFSDVGARVARLTHGLAGLGIVKGSRVAIAGRNCPEYIEAYWACTSVGATVVPLNFRLVAAELEVVCSFTEAHAYFCEPEQADRLRIADPFAGQKPVISWGEARAGAIGYEDLIERSSAAAAIVVDVDSDAFFAILYTGGTSGTPKAVARTHRNALAMLLLQPGHYFGATTRTIFAATPMFHVAGQLAILALAIGNTVVMAEGSFSAMDFLRLVERFKVNAAFVVPTMVAQLALIAADQQFDTASLRELRSGGAPLPLEVAQRLVRRFPSLRLGNGAGSTEAGTYASGWWEQLGKRPYGCIGRPPVGQEISIRNEDGTECRRGGLGEILVRGGQVSPGFWKNAEKTAASHIDDWLHSGDLGYIDAEGFLYLVDRKSDLIISGGENIYARELEEVLHAMGPVREAAVVGMPDEKWGEVPVAFLTMRDGQHDTSAIEAAMTERVAAYKRPRRYVVVDAFPHTTVGKIDKRAMRAMLVPAAPALTNQGEPAT